MNMKYSFFNDYSEGGHPNILNALQDTNLSQETGYGEDTMSVKAIELIKSNIGNPNVAIHFVSGGTQANLIVLASLLKPYESVIAANTAHISVHEAGAIESTGHKINAVESNDGKIKPEQIKAVFDEHNMEHMVKPKVVFISNATELGTIYSKLELKNISDVCKKLGLYLYLDGARIGSALVSKTNDLSFQDVTELVDVYYIGGTKNGALLGEAIVICNPNLQEHFRSHLKQRGALLAKGRVIGIQFEELFKGDLYLQLARHANEMADKLTAGIKKLGYKFQTDSSTNQIFPILPNAVIKSLQETYGFYVWAKIDKGSSSIRLVTSWATNEEAIRGFLDDLKNFKNN
jgi:threonine aldolase